MYLPGVEFKFLPTCQPHAHIHLNIFSYLSTMHATAQSHHPKHQDLASLRLCVPVNSHPEPAPPKALLHEP